MLKISLLPLFLLTLAIFVTAQAFAEIPIVHGGDPDPGVMSTDPGGEFTDIYTRQLAYGDEDVKFRKNVEERQKIFIAPHLKAQTQYRKDMLSRHGSIATSNPDKAGKLDSNTESDADTFGPEFNP